MSDEPIHELGFLGGVKVVDIGDIRVARGLTRRPATTCAHRRLNYDPIERRVWCKDCDQDVDSFDAFKVLVEHYSAAHDRLKERETRLQEAEGFNIRSLAAKAIDHAWRSRNTVPTCPACNQGLFPEDFKDGHFSHLGREYAEAQRKRRLERK
ncbi:MULTISPECIES: hypothetical protein [unclassified Aurantimonas]|uniref:hypothetical protein n=1 Tax=unclassified Aurantimonas TaxID=2638230 RepID=UPI002E19DF95|nr:MULTISPECIES: hypothetical protein [unclassified Aurantimonas]MEC5289407.1 hypothetical protein [Aurantimonas sp. C2-3-R2]MEC5410487.1 hypothetical protein [Aurantimonas sp. C2-4-R8]